MKRLVIKGHASNGRGCRFRPAALLIVIAALVLIPLVVLQTVAMSRARGTVVAHSQAWSSTAQFTSGSSNPARSSTAQFTSGSSTGSSNLTSPKRIKEAAVIPPPRVDDLLADVRARNAEPRATAPPPAVVERQAVVAERRPAVVVERKQAGPAVIERRRALLFTMDSMVAYERNAAKGGASGEIAIRKALVASLSSFGVDMDVAKSDADFNKMCPPHGEVCDSYAFIVLDAWTWAAPGWKPKQQLIGREHRVFLLDFFGAKAPRNNGIKVDPKRILTAFPTVPYNTYLGYFMTDTITAPLTKKAQGVIWGKDPKHYKGKEAILRAVSRVTELHSTLPPSALPSLKNENIVFHGHLNSEQWRTLLGESAFVIGLGDPLLGPSAVDAVAAGCVYIDPRYPAPIRDGLYRSQHPFMVDRVGEPYVCEALLENPQTFAKCAEKALVHLSTGGLKPLTPDELKRLAYDERVRQIFGEYLPTTVGNLSAAS